MMSTLLFLCLAASTPAQDRAAYEAARARAGRDADAHVKLALWCEAHGLKAERFKHLTIAVISDPRNVLAQQSDDRPTFVEAIAPDYRPRPPGVSLAVAGSSRINCFGAGTVVRTRSGSQAIETLRAGDVVLTQNTVAGALAYQPVIAVHRNPPSKTFRIKLGGEPIISSEFHRFWKAGLGWVMARDLTPGNTIRTLGGLVEVEALDEDKVQPVFNLEVAENADFFVGKAGALVHDNSLPDARLAPFDATPNLAGAEKPAKPSDQADALQRSP